MGSHWFWDAPNLGNSHVEFCWQHGLAKQRNDVSPGLWFRLGPLTQLEGSRLKTNGSCQSRCKVHKFLNKGHGYTCIPHKEATFTFTAVAQAQAKKT
jgi:hypothetical protein